MNLILPNNWTPRDYQKPVWKYLSSGGKRAVLKWHRRAGKDDVLLHWTAYAAHQRIGNYWYMLPEAKQARKAIWDAINPNTGLRRIYDVFPKELIESSRDDEMILKLRNGSTFQVIGSDNFNSLVGTPPIGLVFSEYAISNPNAWVYLMPIVEENGGWVAFNSTPRGKNHFKDLCELANKKDNWFYSTLDANQSGVFTEDQLQNILAELQSQHGAEYGLSMWKQEYFVSFDLALPGSIWGDCLSKAEEQGRITKVPHTKGVPVYTAWDLGFDDDTICWYFQIVGDWIHIIDRHQSQFRDIPGECLELYNKHIELGYQYGTHWLPHDARPRTKAGGGKSMMDQFIDWNRNHDGKLGKFAITPSLDVQEGIQAARATLPFCKFDLDNCSEGIDNLKAYRREFDDEKNVFSARPLHDSSSHDADAFRYLSLIWKRVKNGEIEVSPHEKLMAGNVVNINFGQLKDKHFKKMKQIRGERY